MALPGNVGYGTITGELMDSLGAPAEGTVTFTPSFTRLLNVTATPALVILPKPVIVALSSGGFTANLVATDDADNNPTGWTYKVEFKLTGARHDSFSIAVPEGSTQDLATLAPVASANGVMISRGPGVPPGGADGQVLAKASGEDMDTEWITPPTGGGGGSSAWDDITGKPAVIAAGSTQAAARTAIGAGTSSLALGTSSTTAKAGDYQPTWTQVTSKPSTFAPAAHQHGAADINTGTLDAARIPTLAQSKVTNLPADLAGKLTDASGQTTRWRGVYATEADLPTGQAGDFAITLG